MTFKVATHQTNNKMFRILRASRFSGRVLVLVLMLVLMLDMAAWRRGA